MPHYTKAMRIKPHERIRGMTQADVQMRHDRFYAEFQKNGGNATQAAIHAGYSPKNAHVIGSQLATRFSLRSAASVRASESIEKSGLAADALLEELRRIAMFDIRRLYDSEGNLKPISELDDETASAVASLDHSTEYEGRGDMKRAVGSTSKIRMHDKLAAIDKAMRHLGLYERDNRQKDESLTIQVGLVAMPAPPDPEKI
jgi:phage terminase small subunit